MCPAHPETLSDPVTFLVIIFAQKISESAKHKRRTVTLVIKAASGRHLGGRLDSRRTPLRSLCVWRIGDIILTKPSQRFRSPTATGPIDPAVQGFFNYFSSSLNKSTKIIDRVQTANTLSSLGSLAHSMGCATPSHGWA